jgi:MMPL family
VSTLVQNIVALIGLGVAIDYVLLIVTRWREERGRGLDNRTAVLRASATAGSSVLFSGITVAVSLAALALTSVPFLRSIGLAAMLIPLISIAVSATLLPVVLDAAGPALEWPRCRPARTVSPLWTGIARRVTARPGWQVASGLPSPAPTGVPFHPFPLPADTPLCAKLDEQWVNKSPPRSMAHAHSAPAPHWTPWGPPAACTDDAESMPL